MRFGKEVLGQGDGAFVPGNTPYTFVTGSDGVEFLEFRNATAWNIVFKSNNPASWAKGAEKTRALHESRSEEHTSELQSLMRIQYAVFCLQKKNAKPTPINTDSH